jgi:RHS repeat-associated protein
MRFFPESLKIAGEICLFMALAIICIQAVTPNQAQASSQPYIPTHQTNFGTGNKYLSATDASLSGPGGTLSFSRTYNSQSTTTGALGYGWSTTFTERLIIEASAINLVQDGGRYVVFKNDGSGNWINETGKKRIITANGSGYQLKEPSGTIRQYDSSGRLLNITDKNNNTQSYTYAGDQLTSIADNFGHTLAFTYTNGKLTGATSALGAWSYSYQNDNLVTVGKPDGATIHYIYDDPNDAHNLTGIIDEAGARILTVAYDNQDRVTSSSKANGAENVTIAYPGTYLREVTNSLGVKTSYQLDLLHGIFTVGSMTGPGCTSCGENSNTNYLYDARLQIIEATDANEVKTSYVYDASGNPTSITKALGTPLASVTTKTYDPVTNRVATISRPSVANPGQQTVTTMDYDTHGNLLTRQQSGFSGTIAITATTQYTYNTYGQITTIDGPRTDVNDTVSFAYYPNEAAAGNNRSNLHTVTDALGHTTTFSAYNAFGQAETVTDPNGIVTTRAYNGSGLVTAATTAGLTTAYAYNTAGQLQTLTLPGSQVITYAYTPAGQVAGITDSQGNAISYTYDSEGRRTSEEVHDPQNSLTRYANYGYDNYGRMNKVTLPVNVDETSEYDLVGNLVKTVGATAMQTGYQYDALNRLLAVTEAGAATAGYAYDGHDNITQVTDAKSKTTSFTYDDFGRRVSRTAPDTGLSGYGYDQAGNLVSASDAKGQTTSFTYDAMNRPVSQSYSGTGGDILFAYDQGAHAVGHLSQITDREGTDAFAYDSTGRIATETRVIGATSHSIGYSWDAATGELAGMTYPSGLNLSYARDGGGRISGINLNGAPLVSAVSHLPFGPLKTATLGSVDLTRSYDQRYNVNRIKAGSFDYTYTRDNGGHVTGIAGIQTPTTSGDTINYSYNPANNQLTTAAPKSYSYDATGNMIADGTFTFSYDGLNRLVKVEKQGATVATYGYDASNRRIRKTVGAVTTYYLYDLNNQLIAETLVDGTVLREYIYLDGEPLVLKEYQTNPGTYYFINDHLGTPQQLVTSTGSVVWQAAYQPFGQAQIKTETVMNNLRFPGQYYDAETGLHYNWNRYYDPEVGRYISADPIWLDGGMNLYAYVGGNPVNFFDLSGLTWTSNWEFFWDWVLEGGSSNRMYGQGTIEVQEMSSSPGANKMRAAYKAANCRNIHNGSFGTIEAYIKTMWMPNGTGFQVGGFLYDAVGNGDDTVTYTIRNQASAYSFFLHIPGVPHKPRGGELHLFGNIDQVFTWTEKSPCCK